MITLDVISEMDRLQEEVNRLFSRSGEGDWSHNKGPLFNIWKGEESLTVCAELPGVDINTMDISINGNHLTLRGEIPATELKEKENWIRRERRVGTFVRSIHLPVRVQADKVEARYTNGVLTIALPHAEEEKPKRIQVKAS